MLSLILGIAALVSMAAGYFIQTVDLSLLIWAGVALGIVAWILGAKAVKRNKSNVPARVGKILGIVATIVGILLVVFVVLLAGMIMNIAAGM